MDLSGPPAPVHSLVALEILLLAIAGGGVDAVILLGFGALTAAQTGNTILLAVALSQHHLPIALNSAVSIGSYVGGAAIGELILDARRTARTRITPIGWTLLVELLAMGAMLGVWFAHRVPFATSTSLLLVGLAAVAMGLQSAAVIRVHAGPATTYVTGTLTTFTTDVIRWPHIIARQGNATSRSAGRPWIYGVTWLVYLTGATVTGLLYRSLGAAALGLPAAAVAAVIVVTIRSRPASQSA